MSNKILASQVGYSHFSCVNRNILLPLHYNLKRAINIFLLQFPL